jgi:hypothetical protein
MIYQLLYKKRRKVSLLNSEQYKFYAKHASSYASILSYYHFSTNETNPFRILQANIIIKALLNKELIESHLEKISLDATQERNIPKEEFIKNKVWEILDQTGSPYFVLEKTRIYIPVFSRSLNIMYNEECAKLLEKPYNVLVDKPKSSCVDLFDTYGLDLYNSPFTSLIKIKDDKTSSSFYDPDFEVIYVINKQGRLDLEIHLFDKYLKNMEKHHTLSKIEMVMSCFYNTDYPGFVDALYKNKLISKKIYLQAMHKMDMKLIKQDKIYNKGIKSDEVL